MVCKFKEKIIMATATMVFVFYTYHKDMLSQKFYVAKSSKIVLPENCSVAPTFSAEGWTEQPEDA